MRLFGVLPVLSLLLDARATFLDLRQPAPHRLDVRDTSDTCAALDENLLISSTGILILIGGSCFHFSVHGRVFLCSDRSTDQCLCLSGINDFIETRVLEVPAVATLDENGRTLVANQVTDILPVMVCGRWFKLCMAFT